MIIQVISLFCFGCICGFFYQKIVIREVGQDSQKKLKYSELFCGVASVVLYNRFSLEMIHFSFIWLLFSWLYLLSIMDLLSHSFSSRIFYSLGLILCLLRIKLVRITLLESILSISEIALLLMSLRYFMKKVYHKDMIGDGDIELLIVLAFIFGLSNIHWIILLSSVLGIPFCLYKKEMPFVPFISVASFVVLYFGVPLF